MCLVGGVHSNFEPSEGPFIGLFNLHKIPDTQEITLFYILDQVFHLSLTLRIGLPADIHPDILFLDKVSEISVVDNIPGVFTHYH